MAACSMDSMAAICAPSGVGKTHVLKALAAKMSGLYIYCHELSRKGLIQDLAIAAGVTGRYHTASAYMGLIVERLRGTRRPIFLDEAHRIKPEAIGVLRTVHDLTGCPVIMAGTSEILHLIDDTAHGGGQFHSRTLQLNLTNGLPDASPGMPDGTYQPAFAQGKPLFTVEEVRQLFEGMTIRFNDDALALLAAVASIPGRGGLRTVRRVVELLAKQDTTRTITRRNVLDALGLLFADAGVYLAKLAQRQSECPPQSVAAG